MIPWRVLGTILFLVIFVVFASFNLENSSNINLIFTEFENVPVFLSLPAAFLGGCLFMFPFLIGGIYKKNRKIKRRDVAVKSETDKK